MPRANDRIGPYQLSKKLGKGGFGEVWLAKNITALVAREVALKIPHDEDIDLDTIKQEAAIWLAASGHDNILPFIEANVYDDYVVFVSEYAPDGSLHGWLKQHGGRAPSIEAALEMTRGILKGIAHLHERGIIHRDLKPANVLLRGTTPLITDFGIARFFDATKSAVIAGTPVYMAPETFDANRNQQTDVWSVGVMLYQMLAGRLPFVGETSWDIEKAIRAQEPHPLPANVPTWLQQVVAEATAKNPAARYKTAMDMLSALESTPAVVPPKPKPSRRVWLVAIGTAALGLSIWAGFRTPGEETGTGAPTPNAPAAKPPAFSPKLKPTATATATLRAKATPTPLPTVLPKPSPKIILTPLPTPTVVVPPKRSPKPSERKVVIMPDKSKPTPRPKKQDPDCIFNGRCK